MGAVPSAEPLRSLLETAHDGISVGMALVACIQKLAPEAAIALAQLKEFAAWMATQRDLSATDDAKQRALRKIHVQGPPETPAPPQIF